MKKYKFEEELIEGIIRSRPNRFIMIVEIGGKKTKAHCPSTGRIGNIDFKEIPCLLSKSKNKNRKTKYTVEAISTNSLKSKNKKWIGINQIKVNSYIDFFLKNNQLEKIIKSTNEIEIKREVRVGDSRIDFAIGNAYLEVKMPLINLPSKGSVAFNKKTSKFNSFDRLIKHFKELAKSINKSSRAIIVLCFVYDAETFSPPKTDNSNRKIKDAVRDAREKGVESWQVNLKIDKEGVSLIKYFKLNLR